MEELTIFDIAAGVMIGNLLSFSLVMSLRYTDKKNAQSWADVPTYVWLGAVLPLVFLIFSIWNQM